MTNKTYIDVVCRTIPLRQRVLMGLGLKVISFRLQQKYNEKANVIKEYNRLSNMTDEEYELEVSGNIGNKNNILRGFKK